MGDHHWYLLDQPSWDFLEACCEWHKGKDAPVPPAALVDRILEERTEHDNEDDIEAVREDVIETLTMGEGASTDNDVALQLTGSMFNGECYTSYDASIKNLNAFVKKHNLDMEEAYEGYIY